MFGISLNLHRFNPLNWLSRSSSQTASSTPTKPKEPDFERFPQLQLIQETINQHEELQEHKNKILLECQKGFEYFQENGWDKYINKLIKAYKMIINTDEIRADQLPMQIAIFNYKISQEHNILPYLEQFAYEKFLPQIKSKDIVNYYKGQITNSPVPENTTNLSDYNLPL